MKKNTKPIIVTILVLIVAISCVTLYNFRKSAKLENEKAAKVSWLQRYNVDIKSDDVKEYKVLTDDIGGFPPDGSAFVRYKLNSSTSLDKIFKKEADLKDTSMKDMNYERKSMLTSDDIDKVLSNEKDYGTIEEKIKVAMKNENFISKDNIYAYEKIYKNNTIYKIGIVSFNSKNNEILFYFSEI